MWVGLEFVRHFDVSQVVIHQVFPSAKNNATTKSNLIIPWDLVIKSNRLRCLDNKKLRQLNVGVSGIYTLCQHIGIWDIWDLNNAKLG